MTNPMVSVIIPTYNSAQTIRRSIMSVLDQSLTDLEVIVVNDGSTDNTSELINSIPDTRVTYIQQPNRGVSAARNQGIANASGCYIAFLDADDYWLPMKLEKQIDLLSSQPELGMVYSKTYVVNEEGRKLYTYGRVIEGSNNPSNVFPQLILNNFIPTPTVVICKGCVHEVGFFDENLRQSEDWDYYLRIAERFPIIGVNEPLACYRIIELDNLKKMSARGAQSAWIDVVEKHQDSEVCSREVYNLAYALAWFKGAVLEIGLGNSSDGLRRLEFAYQWEPDLLIDYEQIILDIIVNPARMLCGEHGSSKKGEEFLDALFQVFPKTRQINHLHRKAFGLFFASRYFLGQFSENQKLIRSSFLPMIVNQPQWLWNRGVWSIILHSFMRRH